MKFHKVDPDKDGWFLLKFESETGRWEFGITRVLFGVRVSAHVKNSPTVLVDYCAADQPAFAYELLATMAVILESLPESISEDDLYGMLPKWTVRPINKDPECWPKLKAMAAKILIKKEKEKNEFS